MRPVSPPDRSARRLRVRFPVISQSGDEFPSPGPLIGSLLVTPTILQEAAPQPPEVVSLKLTPVSLWFGGHNVLGDALTVVTSRGGQGSISHRPRPCVPAARIC